MECSLIAGLLEREMGEAHAAQSCQSREAETDLPVRSSVTAENLPTARFAGRQETYLNVQGVAAWLETCQ